MMHRARMGRFALSAFLCFASDCTQAQSAADIAVLRGLAPVTILLGSDARKSALAANYAVTGGIQTGTIAQPSLLPRAAPSSRRATLRRRGW